MTSNKARKIAADWQTGPFTALALFAQTGTIEKDRLRKEIKDAAEQARKLDNEDLITELGELREHIEK